MATPTPAIPVFTDGMVVHATDLNALASNLTNLYNYNQASFNSQRPSLIVKATSTQSIPSNADTIVTFQSAVVNTDNMWTASVPTQVTIQHAGIYLIFSQLRWPTIGAPGFGANTSMNILTNSTSISNAIAGATGLYCNVGLGHTVQCATIANLAAGATIFLNAWQSDATAQPLQTNLGGSYIGATFITPST